MAENNVQDQDQIKLPDPIIFTDAASLGEDNGDRKSTRLNSSHL